MTLAIKLRLAGSAACALGLVYLLYVHLNAIDFVDLSGKDHVGIVGVGPPLIVLATLVLVYYREKELKELDPNLTRGPRLLFRALFGEAPYLVILVLAAFLYSNYYGFFLMADYHGNTEIQDGEYLFTNHGSIIKELTEAEFLQYEAIGLKMTTATLMSIYAFGVSVLFPGLKKLSGK